MTERQQTIYRSLDYRFAIYPLQVRFWIMCRFHKVAHPMMRDMVREAYAFIGGGPLRTGGDSGPYDDPPEWDAVAAAAIAS